MNLHNLYWAIGLYMASCGVMVVAGWIKDQGVKLFLLVLDQILSIISYVLLALSFHNHLYSWIAVVGWFIFSSGLGKVYHDAGYDPYGTQKMLKENRARKGK